jgi:hypothetical protein
MIPVLIGARLLLSAIFLIAGSSKLADPAGSRRSMRDFGVPDGIAGVFAVLLPVGELVVAAALIPGRSATYAAAGALALLIVFVCGIAANLIRGRQPDCNCFGQLHSQPIGWDLVARNIGLAFIPGLMLFHGRSQPSLGVWVGNATAGHQLLFVLGVSAFAAMAVQGWLIFQLVQQGGRLLLRLDQIEGKVASLVPGQAVRAAPRQPPGLPVGQKAPSFALPDLEGRVTSLENLLAAGRPLILLFIHPDCGPCTALLQADIWPDQDRFHLVLISQGNRKRNLEKLAGSVYFRCLLQHTQEVSDAYDSAATPSAVQILPDGVIGSAVVSGAEQIQALIARVVQTAIGRSVSIPT